MLDHLRTALSRCRRTAAVLTALAALAATAGVAASPAQAGDQPGQVWYAGIIRSWAQGRCLTTNDRAVVSTMPCNDSPYQQWYIIIQTHPENEWASVQIRSVATSGYLRPICADCSPTWQPEVMTHARPSDDPWLLFPADADWSAWRFAYKPGIGQRCLDANEPSDTTGRRPYLSFTDHRPNPDPILPPDFCTSNFQDWKLGF
jgi:hypothetical protein